MKRKNLELNEIYETGLAIGKVLEFAKDPSPDAEKVVGLLDSISKLTPDRIESLEEIKKSAKGWRKKLKEELGEGKEVSEANLTGPLKEDLRDEAHEWKIKFENFLGNSFFTVPDVDFSVKKLRKCPDGILSEKAGKKLTDLEAKDLKESCHSLLAKNYTACEIMALKTAASMLGRWYNDKTGRKLSGSWGTILNKLDNEYPLKEPKELKLLDYLLERKNVVMNPDDASDKTDAESTLRNVLNLAEEIRKPKPKTYLPFSNITRLSF